MRTTRFPRIMIAVAIAGGLLLAACGDDTAALSKEDFVAQADAICAANNDELDPIFTAAYEDLEGLDMDDPANQQEVAVRFAEAMDQAEPLMRQQVEDLRALAPPESDGELIDTMLDDLDAGVTAFVTTIDEAAAGDEAALAKLADDSEDPLADVNLQAREYGLTICGDPGE
jgi:hypothetical protein